MMSRISKFIRLLLLILSCFFLVSVIFLGFFTWASADDYGISTSINGLGIIQHVLYHYNNWDGRAISLGVIQAIFLKYLTVPIINAIWASCLVLSSLFIYKIIRLYLRLPTKDLKSSTKISLVALISATLWFGMKYHIAQTVYWATGGVYIYAFLLSLIWLYIFVKTTEFKTFLSVRQQLLYVLFSIYIGALSFNLSCSIIAFLGIEILICLIKNKSQERPGKIKWLLLLFASIIVGALIIIVAPGNLIRATHGNSSFVLSLPRITYNFIRMTYYYVRWSIPLIVMLVISTPFMITIIADDVKSLFAKRIHFECTIIFNKEFLLITLRFIQYPLAAIASIIPFLALPDFMAVRTSIYFMEFLTVWLLIKIIPKLINLFLSKKSSNKTFKPVIFSPYVIIFLAFFQYLIITHMISLNNAKHEVLKREKYIQTFSNQNIDVVVGKISTKLPFSFQFYTDISDDRSNWINISIANHYKIKSIRSNKSYY